MSAHILPNFLVIGAYKAGTTSLFTDLSAHPDVFVPEAKEIGHLANSAVASSDGQRTYAAFFLSGAGFSAVGEVAPQYAADPWFTGVPARAHDVLGSDLRLIYMVRHPIERLESHLNHVRLSRPEQAASLDHMVKAMPKLVDVSRYGHQLDLWRAAFPADQILVQRFEDYVTDPAQVRAAICAFLNVAPLSRMDGETWANITSARRSKPAWVRQWLHTEFYRRHVKPIVPRSIRRKAARTLFRAAPLAPDRFSSETRAALHAELAPDIAHFHELLGLSTPMWQDFC